MNQLEAFELIYDQIARDLLSKRAVLNHKRRGLTKALMVLAKTIDRRSIAAAKRRLETI